MSYELEVLFNDRETIGGPLSFPLIRIIHNHGERVLKNATWTPYEEDNQYSCNGTNGFLVGEVVEGHSTSRILQYSVTETEEPGKVVREDYCCIRKLRDHGYTIGGVSPIPSFNQQFCG